VGAILLFGWQSLSWTVLNLHENEYKYTPAQDTIMKTLSSVLKEEGQYGMPRLAPGTSHEKMEEYGKQNEGKPWAMVIYHPEQKMDMTMQIIKGFIICLVCVWLCCLVIARGSKSFMDAFVTALTFGVVCFLFVWYVGHNWMHTPWDVLKPELVDDLVGWGLTGIWLGWWYGRGRAQE
ncbi:MAG TPA: hypothetical protein VKH37_09265, partial [Ferruginibacter sp.]|nr:hypothetical protein [Ferruginibacter sp.]